MSETFGVWELRERLGQNELGDTHLALRADGVQAVIKRIRVDASDERLVAALTQEIALAAQLQHPSAARILEQGEINGIRYVAIEHVLGISLARCARAAQELGAWPLPLARAAQVMAPVLEALAAAHALSPPLLHRELVPENVRIDGQGRVVLTDFGLGRARLRAGGNAGMRGAFISPEQARGAAIDARSEVFAAGLMLFELLCGRLPAAGGPGEVISRIATGELDAPLAVNPKLDPAAVPVLGRALATKPEDRFASAAEFSAALAPWTAAAAPDAEPLGAWAAKLALVKLPAPAPVPRPAVAAAAAAPLAPAPKPSAANPAVAARVPAKGRRVALVAALAAMGVFAVTQLVDVRSLVGSSAPAARAARPLELVTIPSGAQVYVDGFLEERRTPLTLYFGKDELRNLSVRKPGIGSWSGIVYNTRRLELTLATGTAEEERYEGGRPTPKPPPAPPAPPEPPEPAEAPKAEVVFDVESPPIDTVLTAAHSVRADGTPALALEAGAELALIEGASLYYPAPTQAVVRNPRRGETQQYPPQKAMTPWGLNKSGTSYRVLNLFAMHVEGGQVQLLDLSRPVTVTFPGQYHFFTPTEAGELSRSSASMRVDTAIVPILPRHLLHVDAIDSFLVRVLQPKVKYRLELTRADGTTAPLPPVVLTMRPDADPTMAPDDDYQSSVRFDHAEVPSGQVVVGPGVHTLTGARNAWFTIITAEGVASAEVRLSLKPLVTPPTPKGGSPKRK